jgi:hypothetical protein
MNAQYLYSNPPNIPIRDIVTGDNGYATLPGYDLATGLGAWSSTPGAPVLNATGVPGAVTLDWSRPSGAPVADYRIWRGAAPGEETTDIATVVAPTTTYYDSSLPVGSTGYYEVQAVNDLGVGAFSDEASGSPAAPDYSVSFDANGGTGSMAPETDNDPTPLTADSFARSGYSFASWNTAANGPGTAYADGATYPFSASATLYARWRANTAYTVTFDANGGTGSMAPETDNDPTPLTADSFARSGYSFASWNTAANGPGTAYADGATYPFSASATLYARWTVATTFTPSAPTVTATSPVSGPVSGGTSITVIGTGFSTISGDSTIEFGTTASPRTSCSSTTRCTAIAPGEAAGTVNVVARTPQGTSATSSVDRFTYESDPTITKLTPRSGPTMGGTRVTIRGANFVGTVSVHFGKQLATNTHVLSSAEITAVAPSGSGTVQVTVSATGGSSNKSADSTFMFVSSPTIAQITPNRGPKTGGTRVKIRGHNFVGNVSVYFGVKKAKAVHVLSSRELTAITPPRPGTVYVTVITVGGSSKKSAARTFTFVAPPTITKITPAGGPELGGTRVLIRGHDFVGKVSVYFGARKAADIRVLSSRELTAITPPRPGTVYVTVSAAGGSSKKSATTKYFYRVK